MATHITRIVVQALLAKGPALNDVGKIYKDLSTIPLDEALRIAPDYLAAVANIVDIDTRRVVDKHSNRDEITRAKRGVLVGYLQEAKTRPESSGPFLRDVSGLLVNVQRVWVALSQERPQDRFLNAARAHPELILPKAFAMRVYFKENEVDPREIETIKFAAQIPERTSGHALKRHPRKRGLVYH